ncbi:MAG: Serine/threonine protein phosphatase [Monoraphidium minutum]|nr:MAG: Serine/threonine protein phosphatase [Monoraphidium minutum]
MPALLAGCGALARRGYSPWLARAMAAQLSGCAQAEPALDMYRINLITGNVRGAGTNLPAYVQLIGTNGTSEKVLVGEDGLPRGSSVAVDLQAPKDMGELRRCFVERGKSGYTNTGDGWFLEMVEVVGPHQELYQFPCHAWFGHSDCGDYVGALERNLIPVKADHSLPVSEILGPAVRVQAGGISFPHPDKVKKGDARGVNKQHYGFAGEDAYFCCTGRNNIFGMGVADGVYMWKEQGIDSGAMSRALMETSMHMVQAGCEDVLKVLQVAARHVQSEGVMGSSTACLVTINRSAGRLQAATLGDSGMFVIGRQAGGGRAATGSGRLEVRWRTPQQEHEFGRPYQLGHFAHADVPEDADLATFVVHPGDVIVAGSDGLLDNLSELEILEEVGACLRANLRASQMAQRIAKAAFEASVDRKRVTPYSRAATEAFDMVYSGGKKDDIAVVVALVTEDTDKTP